MVFTSDVIIGDVASYVTFAVLCKSEHTLLHLVDPQRWWVSLFNVVESLNCYSEFNAMVFTENCTHSCEEFYYSGICSVY